MDEDEIKHLIELVRESYDVVVYETPNSATSLTDQQREFIAKLLEAEL